MGRLKGLGARLSPMSAKVRAMPKVAESFYTSAEWRAYRAAHRAWTIVKQGGVWCCKCGSTKRLTLDHRKERKDGGADFPPYEEADWYCAGCHGRKTAQERARRAGGG